MDGSMRHSVGAGLVSFIIISIILCPAGLEFEFALEFVTLSYL